MKALPTIKSTHNPYFDVALGMVLTLIIFYPLYKLTSNWMKLFSGHYVKHAKKIHRNNSIALFIGFLIGIIILFGCFMMIKFNINVISEIVDEISS
jgi:uncharacterized protein YacL